MLTVIDPVAPLRWANGVRGVVTDLVVDPEHNDAVIVEVTAQQSDGTPIIRLFRPDRFSITGDDGEETAVRLQYPLTLAYAVSIHKIQGDSPTTVTDDLACTIQPDDRHD